MKRNKLKLGCLNTVFIILFTVIVVFSTFIGSLFLYDIIITTKNLPKNTEEFIENNTGIEIPIDSQMIFKYKGDNGFAPGREVGYYVYKFECTPLDWLEENKFSEQADESFEDVWSDYIPEWVEPISSEYIPEFEKPYYWLVAPNLYYFVYQPDKNMLMVMAQPW